MTIRQGTGKPFSLDHRRGRRYLSDVAAVAGRQCPLLPGCLCSGALGLTQPLSKSCRLPRQSAFWLSGAARHRAAELAAAEVRSAPAAELAAALLRSAPAAELAAALLRPAPAAELAAALLRPAPAAELAAALLRPAPAAELAPARLRSAPAAELAPARLRPAPAAELAPALLRSAPAAELAPALLRSAPAAELAPARLRSAPAAELAPEPQEGAPRLPLLRAEWTLTSHCSFPRTSALKLPHRPEFLQPGSLPSEESKACVSMMAHKI